MPETIFGYKIDGNIVDIYTYVVAIFMVFVSILWSNIRVWLTNRNSAIGSNQQPYPIFGDSNKLIKTFLAASSLVPFFYMSICIASSSALKDLLEANKYTMAISGFTGIVLTLRELFKK